MKRMRNVPCAPTAKCRLLASSFTSSSSTASIRAPIAAAESPSLSAHLWTTMHFTLSGMAGERGLPNALHRGKEGRLRLSLARPLIPHQLSSTNPVHGNSRRMRIPPRSLKLLLEIFFRLDARDLVADFNAVFAQPCQD